MTPSLTLLIQLCSRKLRWHWIRWSLRKEAHLDIKWVLNWTYVNPTGTWRLNDVSASLFRRRCDVLCTRELEGKPSGNRTSKLHLRLDVIAMPLRRHVPAEKGFSDKSKIFFFPLVTSQKGITTYFSLLIRMNMKRHCTTPGIGAALAAAPVLAKC